MQIKELKANPRNPRSIAKSTLAAMQNSLEKFGDLSGIVFNRRTKHLIGAHQRARVLPPTAKITIVTKFDPPTRCFTVAEGYVEIAGERFHYREVDADEEWETEAMLAANAFSGDWDQGKLKVIAADFKKINFEAVGFKPIQLQEFGLRTMVPMAPDVPGHDEDSDAAYARGEGAPEGTETVPPENQGASAFDKADDGTNILQRRFVIIIDCTSNESKAELKEKLQPLVTEAGAKFF